MPTALVTGASSGIGLDLAKLLAARGHHLVLVARNRDALEALASHCASRFRVNASVIVKDLSDPAAPQQIADQLDQKSTTIDILVNNAGFGIHGPFADTDPAAQRALIQVNITSLTELTRLLLPAMIRRRHGRILNVASTAAYVPGPFMSTYYASKAYVLSYSVALARELRPLGVTVTALCPGPTRTAFGQRAGMRDARLFRLATMDSHTVAEAGYRALMTGKTIAIPGLLNQLGAALSRLTPYAISSRITALLNGERKLQ